MFFNKNTLIKSIKRAQGLNTKGNIVCRHRGGICKKNIKLIDFSFGFYGYNMTAGFVVDLLVYNYLNKRVVALIYIYKGLLKGKFHYLLASYKMTKGSYVVYSSKINFNNFINIEYFKIGSHIFNIEFSPNKGSKGIRAAYSTGTIIYKASLNVCISMPSGKHKLFKNSCFAFLGQVLGNISLIKINKAGIVRILGYRPYVRGVAMNAYDHPHGGGKGKGSIGLKYIKTFVGKNYKGIKTTNIFKF